MTNKLQKIAEETIDAIDSEKYKTSSGKTISIGSLIETSVKGSVLYKPDGAAELKKLVNNTRHLNASPEIMVTRESVLEAAKRLVTGTQDGRSRPPHVCLLNFASAKHPGGGFLRGSSAQEESIARSSGLYSSLIHHPEYYEENKKSQSKNIGLYKNYAIYSPNVPVFRNDNGDWLDKPYIVSVVTSPAPNRAAIFNDRKDLSASKIDEIEIEIENIFSARMYQVLSIMAVHCHRTIILGAWGCGIFGNDPLMVAELLRDNLKLLPFFDKVVFPIYDKPESEVFRSFVQIFGQETDNSNNKKDI
jgi:uncharacterized protein (TIGR02452 family)